MGIVVDRDLGWKAILEAALRASEDGRVKVGVLADSAKGGLHVPGAKLSVAEIAAVNEFGTDKIPARPAHRMTFDAKLDDLKNRSAALIGKIIFSGMSQAQALGILGASFAADVKQTITGSPLPGVAPPNAPGYADEKLMKGRGAKKKYILDKAQSPWLGERSKAYDKATGEDANAPSLVRTLVDTGRTVGAITWKVIMGGE